MYRIKNILYNPFIIVMFNRIWIFFIAYFAVLYLPFRERPGVPVKTLTEFPFLDGWTRWDAGWYVSIATNGYNFSSDAQSNVAFFPLYPLTIRLFLFIFKNPYITGIIVSNLAFLTGIYFFHKLLKEHLLEDEDKILWSIIFLTFFPYALFFSAVYSESLFFLCAVLCFYFAEKRKWSLSGLFGMLASADRFVGIALFPAIVVKYMETYRANQRFTPTQNPPTERGDASSWAEHAVPLLSIGLIPLGLAGYMIFLYIKFGDPLAFAHTIGQGWAGMKVLKPDIFLPFKSFFNTILNFSQLPDNKYHVLFQFPIFVFFLTMTFFVFKYFGLSYGLFSFFMLLIPASVSRDLIAMGRYMLVIFPVFAVLPLVLKKNYLRLILLACSGFFLALFTAMFATWWWVG